MAVGSSPCIGEKIFTLNLFHGPKMIFNIGVIGSGVKWRFSKNTKWTGNTQNVVLIRAIGIFAHVRSYRFAVIRHKVVESSGIR